ncbi:MAG: transcription antitermination factor NusB [Candidatus Marinimicrobia bacterium]|nr:transcription antitermination factor NusB [Candidatus Neomarinimicrobiota bacterium]MBL7022796.1 transcription antitermination factor NusB [Candidatus Neomarinimicrobiota bacterium]MBL7109363.1 transcription antitermination factor NusB [Candidatus Neomarinimicrobiota bacterium]
MNKRDKRLARTTALQTLYACELSGNDPGIILDHIKDEHSGDEISIKILEYSGQLARLSINRADIFDEIINSRSKFWGADRIALMDRLIIRLAISEMFYIEDVPPVVTITEAVEISKDFSTENSGRYINGILDSVYKDLIRGKIEIPE